MYIKGGTGEREMRRVMQPEFRRQLHHDSRSGPNFSAPRANRAIPRETRVRERREGGRMVQRP